MDLILKNKENYRKNPEKNQKILELHPCNKTLNSIVSVNPCAKLQKKTHKNIKNDGFTVKKVKKEQKPL